MPPVEMISLIRLAMMGARELLGVIDVNNAQDITIEDLNSTKAEVDATHASLMAKIDAIKEAQGGGA